MLQFSVKVSGTKEVQAKLAKMGRELDNMKRAMKTISEQGTAYFANEAFLSRGGAFKQRWPALSDKYAATKRKKWGNKPLLVASGTMQESFYGEYNNSTATISNSAPQFKYHQSNRSRSVIPRRQMIGVNSRIKTIVKQAIQDEVRRKLREA